MLSPIQAKNLANLARVRHAFFTRQGGVSTGVYASLNCGLGSPDEADRVLENRRRAAAHLGGTFDGIVTLYQEHGSTALTIEAPVARDALPKADAIVSKTPGLVIGVLSADCTPVLFADPIAGIVAAAHAGWRGAVRGILESTINEMERQGAVRDRIVAAIGPCINQISYEVGSEFKAEVVSLDAANARFFARPEQSAKSHFDLPGFVADRLKAAGLGSIEAQTLCTHANESLFYSYRRSTQRAEPDYGRQISAIVVA